MHASFAASARDAILLDAVTAKNAAAKARKHGAALAGFTGAEGDLRPLPDAKGGIAGWVLGLGEGNDAFALAAFAEKLRDGVYRLGDVPAHCGGANAALAWALGGYSFSRYRKSARNFNPTMAMAASLSIVQVHRIVELGELDPEMIVTPGIFIDRLVEVPV